MTTNLPLTAAGVRPDVLTEEESFHRSVLENLAAGVILTDAEFHISYANQVVTSITGYTMDELLGQNPHALFSREVKDGECEAGKKTLEDELVAFDFEMKRKDGKLHWVHVSTAPYRNAQGQVVGRVATINCLERQKSLEIENEILHDDIRRNFGNIVGQSAALQKVLAQIETVAPTQANVLILGESGTGKELVARAIHDLSPRKDRPLVRVNCASIPKELFESEFFGHVRGAYTGAIKDRVGRFELADGGTLFLDEIGEIPLELQGKLLRVLQEGQYERIGEDRTRTVNVRVIAATNRDLATEAKAGRFRLDLYYRLSVFPIELPALRERREDIGALAEHFIELAARRLGAPRPRLTKLHVHTLENYDWPGNVRELQNVAERAVILARGGRLQFDLPQRTAAVRLASAAGPEEAELSLDELVVREREIVTAALQRAHGKIYGADGAAALLNIKPTTLVSKMKRLGVSKAGT